MNLRLLYFAVDVFIHLKLLIELKEVFQAANKFVLNRMNEAPLKVLTYCVRIVKNKILFIFSII